mmetsp:Transcript_40653/g.128186  ORF Transcript_40653/g.128186 Transcript_40653/m.128186 type:complete len:227 (+) Transcript_40653:530-1210(+)
MPGQLRYLVLYRLALPFHHGRDLKIIYVRVDVTLHERSALIIFDVWRPSISMHADLHVKALLLEVANGIVIGICYKVVQVVPCLTVVFRLVHQSRAIPPDLLFCAHRTKCNLSQLLLVVRTVADPPNGLLDSVNGLYSTDRLVVFVEDETNDVLLGHLRELRPKDFLQLAQKSKACGSAIVPHTLEMQNPCFLLLLCCEVSGFDLCLFRRRCTCYCSCSCSCSCNP